MTQKTNERTCAVAASGVQSPCVLSIDVCVVLFLPYHSFVSIEQIFTKANEENLGKFCLLKCDNRLRLLHPNFYFTFFQTRARRFPALVMPAGHV